MIKVILRQNIDRIGKIGQVVGVKDGFARNYLFPKSLAILATSNNMAKLEKEQKNKEHKKELLKKQAETQANKLQNYSCTIPVEAQDENLYGAIGSQEIVSALAQDDIVIGKENVILDQPIKKLGIYEITLQLHPEVTTVIKVWVVKK